jgi:hypothetical protein
VTNFLVISLLYAFYNQSSFYCREMRIFNNRIPHHIDPMSQENSSHRFSVNVERFKALGIVDPKSKSAHDAYDHHEFSSSERLFFKLWGNEQLKSGIFSPGQKVAEKGEHPVFAQVIIAGEVVVTDKNGEHFFGPGSVFGLAEGLCH